MNEMSGSGDVGDYCMDRIKMENRMGGWFLDTHGWNEQKAG